MAAETQSRSASEAELAAVVQQAEEARQREAIRHGDALEQKSSIPGTVKPMTYMVPEQDQASHTLVWELKIDADGREYGIPRKAPRGQLGLWLQKKREADGGIRFTVNQPARILAEPRFPCIRQECRKRFYTRQLMVMHVRSVHYMEAELYKAMLDEIMAQAALDNPRVAELAALIKDTPELGLQSVDANPQKRREELTDTELRAGTPTETTLGIKPPIEAFNCPECDWMPKSNKRPMVALALHMQARHPSTEGDEDGGDD